LGAFFPEIQAFFSKKEAILPIWEYFILKFRLFFLKRGIFACLRVFLPEIQAFFSENEAFFSVFRQSFLSIRLFSLNRILINETKQQHSAKSVQKAFGIVEHLRETLCGADCSNLSKKKKALLLQVKPLFLSIIKKIKKLRIYIQIISS
jgi:hypothetical protein